MVKPSSGSSLSRSGSSAGQNGRPPAVPPHNSMEAEDPSFVVIERDTSSNGYQRLPSMASENVRLSRFRFDLFFNFPRPFLQSISFSLDVNTEDINRKLQEVLKENIELKGDYFYFNPWNLAEFFIFQRHSSRIIWP